MYGCMIFVEDRVHAEDKKRILVVTALYEYLCMGLFLKRFHEYVSILSPRLDYLTVSSYTLNFFFILFYIDFFLYIHKEVRKSNATRTYRLYSFLTSSHVVSFSNFIAQHMCSEIYMVTNTNFKST